MMARIWVISDTHFGHSSILNFKLDDGSPLRDFGSIGEHDETIIHRWNKVIGPEDHVYHLGDVVMNRRCLPIIKRLAGKKRLVRGNHDVFKTKEYMNVGFQEIYGVRVFPKHGIVLSHIPLHPNCLKGRGWRNIHGHLHANEIDDPLYQNVCVEKINYTPLLIME